MIYVGLTVSLLGAICVGYLIAAPMRLMTRRHQRLIVGLMWLVMVLLAATIVWVVPDGPFRRFVVWVELMVSFASMLPLGVLRHGALANPEGESGR